MNSRTLVCYRFSDGKEAYFLKGDSTHHILVLPGETLGVSGTLYDKVEFKQLKIKYSQWLKLIVE